MNSTKEAILRVISANPGIDGVRLVLDVMAVVNPTRFEKEIYLALLNKLVSDKEIVEVEYILADVPYRAKSMYFPQGTTIVINNSK